MFRGLGRRNREGIDHITGLGRRDREGVDHITGLGCVKLGFRLKHRDTRPRLESLPSGVVRAGEPVAGEVYASGLS